MRALIVLNGEFVLPLDRYDLVICCDGAYDRIGSFRADLFVGDGDSVTRDVTIPRVNLPTHKDITDGEAAVEEAIRLGADDITLIGATGGDRFDQVLGNFTLLGRCHRAGVSARVLGLNFRAEIASGHYETDAKDAKYVSVVPFFGSAHIQRSEGLLYPVIGLTFDGDSARGISNEPTSPRFSLDVDCGRVLVILTFLPEVSVS